MTLNLRGIFGGSATPLESPVAHLLKDNLPPTPKERELTLEALTDARARLAIITDRSPPYNSKRSTAKLLTQVNKFIQEHQSTLSLVRILPNEILAQIFTACLPDLSSNLHKRHSWTSIPSFTISWVCQDWRNIALNTPRLWAILADVNLTEQIHTSTRLYVRYIEEILRRSGDTDLTIFVYAPGVYEPQAKRNPVIDLLFKCRQRWSVLVLHAGIPAINLFCRTEDGECNQGQPAFPRLRTLNLNICIRLQGVNITGFLHAPLLEDVSIGGLYPDELLLPYRQLKSYREGIPSSSFIDSTSAFLGHVLTKAAGLEQLEISQLNYHVDSAVMANAARKVKVFLFRLDTSRHRLPHARTLLRNLTLPCLEELRVLGGVQFHDEDYGVVINFIQRSTQMSPQPVLRKLCLRRFSPATGFSSDSLWGILKLTPYLEDIIIDFPDIDAILKLTASMQSPTSLQPMPRLRRIVLHAEYDDIKSYGSTILTLADILHKGKSQDLYHEGMNYPEERHLRLTFADLSEARDAQDILNSWNNVLDQGAYISNLANLQNWRSKLHDMLPSANDEMTTHYEKFTPNKRPFDILFASRLDGIFKEIESFNLMIGTGCTCLYASRLHHSLRRLSQLKKTSNIPGDKKFKFRERSKNILGKWQPILLDDLKINRIRWVPRLTRSLVFVPENAMMRDSASALDMVYGIDEDNDYIDTAWSNVRFPTVLSSACRF